MQNHLLRAQAQLVEYFDGTRKTFDLDLDVEDESNWSGEVFEQLDRVKFGETTTYGQLAADDGCDGATNARERRNGHAQEFASDHPPLLSGGWQGWFPDGIRHAGGLEAKRRLLELKHLHA